MIEIKNPSKAWWAGDIRVEPFIKDFKKTLDKYYPDTSAQKTLIYNRAYEAIYSAIVTYDTTYSKRKRISLKLKENTGLYNHFINQDDEIKETDKNTD